MRELITISYTTYNLYMDIPPPPSLGFHIILDTTSTEPVRIDDNYQLGYLSHTLQGSKKS